MSNNDNNDSSSNDPSLFPVVGGQAALVAGAGGNAGWSGASSPAEAPSAINLQTYLHALRRHWLMAIGLGILCGGICGPMAWFLRGAQYTASAYFRVSPTSIPIVFRDAEAQALAGQNLYETYKETQSQLVKTPFVLQAALRRPEIASLPSVRRNEPDAVGWLSSELIVGFGRNSEIMEVKMSGTDQDEVATLVSAVVQAFKDEVVDKERNERLGRKSKLESICSEKENELREKRNDLKQQVEQLGTGEPEALAQRQSMAINLLADYNRELLRVQFELLRASSELETARSYMASLADMEIPPWEVDAYAQLDNSTRQVADQLLWQKMNMERFKAAVVPGAGKSPVKRYQREMDLIQDQYNKLGDELREKIRDRKRTDAERDIKRLEAEVAILTKEAQHFQEDVDKQRKEADRIGTRSIDVEMARTRIQDDNDLLKSIRDELGKLKVELNSPPRIKLLHDAEKPKVESGRGLRLAFMSLAVVVGFCLPGLGIMVWDTRSKRVNAVIEVARGLGLPVLGSVPTIPAQVLRRLSAPSKRSQSWRMRLTESIDGIVARLLHKAETDQARVILVSSAMAAEGKTTLATQVALSLARHLRRTVLVDFDLRRPALDGIFGLPLEPGVCEALRGTSDVGGMVHPTTTENLAVLPAGHWDRQAMAALANGAAGPLFKQLRARYDFVIVDSSPVLPVADTRFVSQHADTVILSVFRDLSEVPKIQAACEMLEAFGVRNLEAVVTGGQGFSYGREREYGSEVSV